MHATDVIPPRPSAAADPVLIVSSSSAPGSRRWTCMSISPGQTIIPAASMVCEAGGVPAAALRERGPPGSKDRARDPESAGSTMRPLVMRSSDMAGIIFGERLAARPPGFLVPASFFYVAAKWFQCSIKRQVVLDFEFDTSQSRLKLFLARKLKACLLVIGVGVLRGDFPTSCLMRSI